MTAGRPSKYLSEYAEQVIEHMTSGASLTAFAAEIGVARSTINKWIEDQPEFADAVEIAKAKAQAWWEVRGRNMASGAPGNPAIVIFSLKNLGREDFKDRQELEHSGPNGKPITVMFPAGTENI